MIRGSSFCGFLMQNIKRSIAIAIIAITFTLPLLTKGQHLKHNSISSPIVYLDTIKQGNNPIVIEIEMPQNINKKLLKNKRIIVHVEYEQWRTGIAYHKELDVDLTPLTVGRDVFKLEYSLYANNTSSVTPYEILDVKFSYPEESGYEFVIEKAEWARLTIDTNELLGIPLRVWLEFEWDSRDPFASLSGVSVSGLSAGINSKTGNIEVAWNYVDDADGYEIEWVYMPSKDARGNQIPMSLLPVTFTEKGIRKRVQENRFVMPVMYREGYVVFRVRPYRYREDGSPDYGEWTLDEQYDPSCRCSGNTVQDLLTYKGTVIINSNVARESDKSYTAIMMDDGTGKYGFGIEYYDDMLRKIQGQSWLWKDTAVIINNFYYDHIGRQSVATLPWVEHTTKIGYKPESNFTTNGKQFSWEEWEVAGNQGMAVALDSSSGASKFYSQNSDYANRRKEAYIPGASGYPYSLTVFYPDGRVRMQAGPGQYRLGSGKEQVFMYSSVVQGKLDKLFGTDAYDASSYERLFYKDVNGQWHIKYIRLDGKVVAEGLLVTPPDSVDTLVGPKIYDEGYLIYNNPGSESKMIAGADWAVPMKAMIKYIYEFSPGEYKMICGNDTLCLPCQYDVSIAVNSFDNPASNHQYAWFVQDTAITYTYEAKWDSGQYFFNRKIVWLDTPMNSLIDTMLGFYFTYCHEPHDTFKVDTTGCNSCPVCNSENPDWCDQKLKMMLAHLIPGGQYAKFEIDKQTGTRHFVFDAVLNIKMADNKLCTDALNAYLQFYGLGAQFNAGGYLGYHTPLYWDGSNWSPYYYDENGKIDTLWINVDVDPSDIRDPKYIYSIGNKQYTFPKYLKEDVFIEMFKSSWAYSLLPLHPEWCYLKECISVLRPLPGYQNTNTFTYMDTLRTIDNVNDAISGGWLCNIGTRDPLSMLNITIQGGNSGFPMGCQNNQSNPSQYLQYKLNHYVYDTVNNAWLSIWHMAVLLSSSTFRCNPTDYQTLLSMSPSSLCGNAMLWNDSAWAALVQLYNSVRQQVIMGYLHSRAWQKGYYNACIGQDMTQDNFNTIYCDATADDNQIFCRNSAWRWGFWDNPNYNVAFGGFGQQMGMLSLDDTLFTLSELEELTNLTSSMSGVCPSMTLMYGLIFGAVERGLTQYYEHYKCDWSGIYHQWGLDSLEWNSTYFGDSLVVVDNVIGKWLVIYLPDTIDIDSIVYVNGIGDGVPVSNGWLFELTLTLNNYKTIRVRAWTPFDVTDCEEKCGQSLAVLYFLDWLEQLVDNHQSFQTGTFNPSNVLPQILLTSNVQDITITVNQGVPYKSEVIFNPTGHKWTWLLKRSNYDLSKIVNISIMGDCDCGEDSLQVTLIDDAGNMYTDYIVVHAYDPQGNELYSSLCGQSCVGSSANKLLQEYEQWLSSLGSGILTGGQGDVSNLGVFNAYVGNGTFHIISVKPAPYEDDEYVVYGYVESPFGCFNGGEIEDKISQAPGNNGTGTGGSFTSGSGGNNLRIAPQSQNPDGKKKVRKGIFGRKPRYQETSTSSNLRRGYFRCEPTFHDPDNICSQIGDSDCHYDCDGDGICDCDQPPCSVNTLVMLQGTNTLVSLQANAQYQWLTCNGPTGYNGVVQGSTSQQFTVTQSGWYAVGVTYNGCTDTSMCYYISVDGDDSDDGNNTCTGVNTSISVVQTGQSVYTLSVIPQQGASYQWYLCTDNGYIPIVGATYNTFVVSMPGSYAVEVNNGYCSEMSNCITIDDSNNGGGGGGNEPCIGKPEVNVHNSNGTLVSTFNTTPSGTVWYQWYRCDAGMTPEPGVNSSTYTPVQSGSYQVVATYSNGCADTSNCVYINVSGGGGGSCSYLGASNISVSNLGNNQYQLSVPYYNGATYQWYYCVGGKLSSPVPGSTQNFLVVGASNMPLSYAVKVFHNSCIDSSSCVTVPLVNNGGGCASTTISVTLNNNNGNLQASVTGGTPPYTYSWLECNSGIVVYSGTHSSFIPTQQGHYMVIVTDANGCSESSDCEQVQGTGPQCDQSVMQTIANNVVVNGNVLAVQPIQASNVTYEWYECNSIGIPTGQVLGTGNVFIPPSPGNYVVKITWDNCVAYSPCTWASGSGGSGGGSICAQNQVEITTQGSELVISNITSQNNVLWYQWTTGCETGQYIPVNGATGSSFTPSTSGYYSLIVKWNNGCMDTSSCVYIDVVGGGDNCECEIEVYDISQQLKDAVNVEFVEIISSEGIAVNAVYKGQDPNSGQLIYDTVRIVSCFAVEPTCCEPDTSLESISCGWEMPIIPPIGVDSTDYCKDIEEALVNIANTTDSLFEAQQAIHRFEKDYTYMCKNTWEDSWFIRSLLGEYHFTLYYYDRAGNLVRVVPPDGVDTVNVQLVAQARQNGQKYVPNHRKTVDYRYTDENAVWARWHPDRGWDRTWYDFAGRPIVSRDQRMIDSSVASYALYDDISRPIEGGVAAVKNIPTDSVYLLASLSSYFDFSEIIKDRVVTVYDTPAVNSPINDIHNRGMVTAQLRWDIFTGCDTSFVIGGGGPVDMDNDISAIPTGKVSGNKGIAKITCPLPEYAIYFNYDSRGRVEEEVHWTRELDWSKKKKSEPSIFNKKLIVTAGDEAGPANGLFYIQYDYEPASGRVTQITYQPDKPDQWHYKYVYDDYGRLALTMTSRDGIHWHKEARNEYNILSQLIRTTIGEEKYLQGIDFVSTLTGWLKAKNSEALQPDKDPGKDGLAGSIHEHYAQDVFGMVLRYHEGDYYSTGQTTQFAGSIASGTAKLNKPYYNGWISSWSMSLDTMGTEPYHTAYSFRYDQLGRVTEARTLIGWDRQSNSWTADYTLSSSASYRYDAVGNLLKLKRYDQNGQLIDDLTYHYYDLENNNKLEYVSDNAQTPNISRDIETQLSNNYLYDAVGNIIYDNSEKRNVYYNFSNRPLYIKTSRILALSGLSSSGKLGTTGQGGNPTFTEYDEYVYMYYNPLGYRYRKKGVGFVGENKEFNKDQIFIYSSSGKLMAIYEYTPDSNRLKLTSIPIYHGSARIGTFFPISRNPQQSQNNSNLPPWIVEVDPLEEANIEDKISLEPLLIKPQRKYELTDHLNNVRVVIASVRTPVDNNNDNSVDAYKPLVISTHDYYPFGWERTETANKQYNYPFAYQGQIKDNEWNSIYYRFRNYDNRIARFFQVEPLIDKYPNWTTYAFAHNKVPYATELEGLMAVGPVTTRPGEDDSKVNINLYEPQTISFSMAFHDFIVRSVVMNIDLSGNVSAFGRNTSARQGLYADPVRLNIYGKNLSEFGEKLKEYYNSDRRRDTRKNLALFTVYVIFHELGHSYSICMLHAPEYMEEIYVIGEAVDPLSPGGLSIEGIKQDVSLMAVVMVPGQVQLKTSMAENIIFMRQLIEKNKYNKELIIGNIIAQIKALDPGVSDNTIEAVKLYFSVLYDLASSTRLDQDLQGNWQAVMDLCKVESGYQKLANYTVKEDIPIGYFILADLFLDLLSGEVPILTETNKTEQNNTNKKKERKNE